MAEPNQWIDKIVVGVDSVAQLRQNADTFGKTTPLTTAEYEEVNRVIDSLGLTEQVVNPAAWPKRG